jgi:hexulose-6-phosphate isomerase
MINKKKIGFMQGRLSSIVRNKIQAFPFSNWKREFYLANKIGFQNIEWTIDNYKFQKNPIINKDDYEKIKYLKNKFKIEIPTITADFFMEDIYLKKGRLKDYKKFFNFLEGCSKNNIKTIVLPLVDNFSIKNNDDYLNILIEDFKSIKKTLKTLKIEVAFETDLDPEQNINFVKKLNSSTFGINYDIGNSIGYGFNYRTEISKIINLIKNVHIKNKKNNKTCNLFLGEGNIDKIIKCLLKKGYKRNFIFQSARVRTKHFTLMKDYYNHFTI